MVRPVCAWWYLLLAVACGGDASRARFATHRDSAGIDIVDNHGIGRGLPFSLSMEPRVRIGAVDDADPASLLMQVEDVVRLLDGRIVVLERVSGEVRWFSATGEHLLTRGGRGRGPQEVALPMGLVRLAGDSLAVIDGGFELLMFDATGAFVRLERSSRPHG